jgi:molybdopterin-guanine dinucleotide biosynthesis protein A
VLAGGASRRFGGMPKGLEHVGERLRIVDFVVAALGQVTDRILLISNDPRAPAWIPGVDVVTDRHPGAGGLAGVEAALAWGGSRRDVIAVAWDMPFVTGALLQSLVDAADTHGADAAVPQSDSPHGVEPFCAFYSARALRPLTAFLDAGGRAAHVFLRSLERVHTLSAVDVAACGDPKRLLLSVNTPADLERARAMLAGSQ